MGNVHKVAIATDCRDLHFVDVSTASVFEDVHLFGILDCTTVRLTQLVTNKMNHCRKIKQVFKCFVSSLLQGFRSVPTALCYWHDVKVGTTVPLKSSFKLDKSTLKAIHSLIYVVSPSQCPEQPSLLLLGDEKGGVHLMWFMNPSKGLFKNPSKRENGPQRIFFPVSLVLSIESLSSISGSCRPEK